MDGYYGLDPRLQQFLAMQNSGTEGVTKGMAGLQNLAQNLDKRQRAKHAAAVAEAQKQTDAANNIKRMYMEGSIREGMKQKADEVNQEAMYQHIANGKPYTYQTGDVYEVYGVQRPVSADQQQAASNKDMAASILQSDENERMKRGMLGSK